MNIKLVIQELKMKYRNGKWRIKRSKVVRSTEKRNDFMRPRAVMKLVMGYIIALGCSVNPTKGLQRK